MSNIVAYVCLALYAGLWPIEQAFIASTRRMRGGFSLKKDDSFLSKALINQICNYDLS